MRWMWMSQRWLQGCRRVHSLYLICCKCLLRQRRLSLPCPGPPLLLTRHLFRTRFQLLHERCQSSQLPSTTRLILQLSR